MLSEGPVNLICDNTKAQLSSWNNTRNQFKKIKVLVAVLAVFRNKCCHFRLPCRRFCM